ncbi:hypothetical protein Q5H92_08965 [Hymenobacter sp. M29]|uniref:Phage tail protein n=1 Tax=Hymenobacter mellowenesis TaxID=3063995 RepID=A0ABT9ABW4_9BACT|nr:hypothetical protein [Hymenobacter sp. M29]MDO7846486.1 hypothetical protein [Hymenobacter sp. M29]
MLYSLPSTAGYRLAGLKTLLLAPWSGAASYNYASAACSRITNFSGITGWEQIPLDVPGAAQFGEQLNRTKNGKLYTQLVSLSLAQLSDAGRTAVEGLVDAGPVVALLQDYNGQWWLYGQTAGLRLLTANAQSGTYGGDGSQALPLTGTQREAARTVAVSRINLLFNSSTTFHFPA